MVKTERFFGIRNWEKFQHYTKRNPPWIRLYKDLLRDRGYQSLSDTGRSHLVGLFLIASQHDNRIPEDQTWLRHELCTKTPIDLKALAASNWIVFESQDASKMLAEGEMLASCKQVAAESCSETETETDNTEVQRQIRKYGEFASVELTDEQYGKLRVKLNGNLESLIARLDRYSQSNPKEFRKYKSHYATLLNWYDMALERGTIKPTTTSTPSRPTEEEIAREHAAMFGGRKKVT